jgi:AsmA protein
LKPGNYAPLIADLLPEGLSAEQLGNINFKTTFKLETARDRLELTGTQASVLGLTATANMVVSKLSASPSVEGNIRLSPFRPRALARRLKNPLPKTRHEWAFNKVELETRFRASEAGAALDNLKVTFDQTVATGSFEIRDFENPAYEFALNIDRLNLDRYLPPETDNANAAKPGKQADTEIPVALIRGLDMTGQAKIGALQVAKLELKEVAVDISAAAGTVKLQPIKATLYGGHFEGGISVDVNGAKPAIAIDGAISELRVNGLTQALSGEEQGPVTGTGAFKLDLTGQGQTVEQNLQTAAGQVNFQIDKGVLRGFNLEYELCRGYNTLAGVPRPSGDVRKVTKFNQVSGTANVKDGIATSQDLLVTTPSMKVDGGGQLSLPEMSVDYAIDVSMTDAIKLQGCEQLESLVGKSIPVTITGAIEEPKVRPDFGQLVRHAVEDKVKDKLLDILGGR